MKLVQLPKIIEDALPVQVKMIRAFLKKQMQVTNEIGEQTCKTNG